VEEAGVYLETTFHDVENNPAGEAHKPVHAKFISG
jgi:hypothetical protein